MNKLKTIVAVIALTVAGYATGYDNGHNNGQEQKVVEIQNKIQETNMEWYHYQDVESIVSSKSINSEL